MVVDKECGAMVLYLCISRKILNRITNANTYTRRSSMKNFNNLTHKEKTIYFAGLIDGEGHIGCQYYGERKRPVIQLNMTHKEIVELFAEHYGLTCKPLMSPSRIRDYEEKGHKQQYQARTECKKAYPIIKDLYPYLIVKQEDAEKALAYYEVKRNCLHCDKEIPMSRQVHSKYCSEECQHGAKSLRAKQRRKGA